MKNNTQVIQKLMHPLDIKTKSKKKGYKPKLHDLVYLFLCTLIIIGFADNVQRFIDSSVTPKIVAAQERVENAKKALLGEKLEITSPLSSAVIKVEAAEIKNPFDERSPKGIAWKLSKERFGIEHWGALEELINHESGWNPYAKNPNGGACGIPQALPCSKMDCEQWDYECQVKWAINYIADRYENPIKAWEFWQTPHLINGEYVNYY